MPRVIGALAIAATIVLGPIVYLNARDEHRRNFRTSEPGVFYRSGQLSRAGS